MTLRRNSDLQDIEAEEILTKQVLFQTTIPPPPSSFPLTGAATSSPSICFWLRKLKPYKVLCCLWFTLAGERGCFCKARFKEVARAFVRLSVCVCVRPVPTIHLLPYHRLISGVTPKTSDKRIFSELRSKK